MEGRYWIAMAQNIVNPEHPLEHTNKDISADEVSYGTKVDIVVRGTNQRQYYIPCVLGDIKEHSYPDGLFQTGIPFNNSEDRVIVEGDRTTVEFIGFNISSYVGDDGCSRRIINQSNDYELLGIIVYDGVYDYE